MNLIWLEDFLALASTGNFSRAAEERHMTQPAFSRRIRALEEWLGVTLFDRSSHPATLTEAGLWFRTVAQETVARIARIPDEAKAVADASSSTLKFAATHALSFSFMPSWLRSLETRLAIGPIQLVSDVLQQCEALMLQGRVQFMLCHAHEQAPGRLDTPGYRSIRVGSDVLLPVSAPDAGGSPRHALGAATQGRGPVPVLSYSVESGIGRILRSVHSSIVDDGLVEPVFTAHLASVLRTMAIDGRGLAWLPQSLVLDDLALGRLVRAAPDAWNVQLDVRLFRSAQVGSRTAEAFWSAAAASG